MSLSCFSSPYASTLANELLNLAAAKADGLPELHRGQQGPSSAAVIQHPRDRDAEYFSDFLRRQKAFKQHIKKWCSVTCWVAR